MTSVDPGRALSFGRFAEEYDRWRPTYPVDAVDWLVPAGAAVVADVGAGTGKLTGRLLEHGLAVHAVEADPEMLATLRRRHPDAVGHQGTAEALPLPDDSVDAVLVADAWHWFARDEAIAEVQRVLRPGGRLGLVWNSPAPVERWEYELAGVDPDQVTDTQVTPTQADADDTSVPSPQFPPGTVETASFSWTWELTPEHCAGLLGTNSGVAAMDEADRAARLDAARAVVERVCDASGRTTAPVRYRAVCVRWQPS